MGLGCFTRVRAYPWTMTSRYEYDHAWEMERVRLAGLESALDPGTRDHLARLGAGPGARCLEIGAGGGSVAFWLAERVAPDGVVVALGHFLRRACFEECRVK